MQPGLRTAESLAERDDLLAQELLELATTHLAGMADPDPRRDAPKSLGPLPESGTSAGRLLDYIMRDVAPSRLDPSASGFMAYIPGGNLHSSAVADYIAQRINPYVSVREVSRGPAAVEQEVIDWFSQWCGYDDKAGGLLTTGGSIANFTAIVAARHKHLGDNASKGVLYIAADAHHSILKGAFAAGIPRANIAHVPMDEQRRMNVDALHAMIRADRKAGRKPFMVIATAGTTNTGAVDDLEALAGIGQNEHLWLHIDGAYGGFFVLTEGAKKQLAGMAEADSITLDPHKGLGLPFGTGALIARNAQDLRAAFGARGDYMPELNDERGDFAEMGLELTRAWRGLRVWLPLRLHGKAAFRHHLQERLDWIHDVHKGLQTMHCYDVITEPSLSILTFRARRVNEERTEDTDARTMRILNTINAWGRIYLSATLLEDRPAIRICLLGLRTSQVDIDTLLEDLEAAALAC